MPYNMWFLTAEREVEQASEWIKFVSEISEEIEEEQIAELTEGTPREWRQIAVTYPDGEWSFDFERRSVATIAADDDPAVELPSSKYRTVSWSQSIQREPR